MAYFLGVDGGGSKTTCAVGDEISLLATVTTGPSNITRVGEARARESLHQAMRGACAEAEIDPGQVLRACVGIAGGGREEVAHAVQRMVADDLISAEIEVVGDMQIALEAAFGAGPGVIVIAGTGSIAFGRDAQEETARAGGWGFAISDEGSAHWIGRTAVSTLLRAADRSAANQEAGDAAGLCRELKRAWKLRSFDELVLAANSSADFAALFPAVLAAADGEDALGQEVLARAGRELACLAAMVSRRLFAENNVSQSHIPLAMAGGVFGHSERVREAFCDEIRKLDSRFEVKPQIVEPVVGALLIARRTSPEDKTTRVRT